MKTSSYFKGKVKENFEKFFDKSLINRLGKVSGFIKRKTNKITAFAFVAGFIESCFKGRNTYCHGLQISALSVDKLYPNKPSVSG